MKPSNLKLVKRSVMRPVASKGREPNNAYRTREHLTQAEMTKLLAVLKTNRHGHRDWLIGLLIYRHGLRVSEACDLRWDDLDLPKRTIAIRRLKGSTDSSHFLERDEVGGDDASVAFSKRIEVLQHAEQMERQRAAQVAQMDEIIRANPSPVLELMPRRGRPRVKIQDADAVNR
jgi:integrase